jgi:hypothetical protein
LPASDWTALATNFYSEIFSVNFLTPLCEADKHFKLETHNNLDLSRYTSLLHEITDVLDLNAPELVKSIGAPRGSIAFHKIPAPYLHIDSFDPQAATNNSLQLPHLVRLAVLVYNQTSNQPIELDSERAADVLRLIEQKAVLNLPHAEGVNKAIVITNDNYVASQRNEL